MGTARYYHCAVRLNDGKVLVIGAYNPSTSAELYNPLTGTFTPVGSMHTARGFATASTTLLPNGKVLVAGGYTYGVSGMDATSSAELFDPATRTFTITGSMNYARSGHTATLLLNGKVLIAGASNAELFDPSSGTFSIEGSMVNMRDSHTATLLPDGKVLIAGGSNGAELASAEVYDPAVGMFVSTGSMLEGRFSHTATLLPNGEVLMAGGSLAGGEQCIAGAEIYSPATGTFSAAFPLTHPRSYHTATLLRNGKVLVTGGFLSVYPSVLESSSETFDPATRSFLPSEDMTRARAGHTATPLLDGKVLITGGDLNGLTAEVYLLP